MRILELWPSTHTQDTRRRRWPPTRPVPVPVPGKPDRLVGTATHHRAHWQPVPGRAPGQGQRITKLGAPRPYPHSCVRVQRSAFSVTRRASAFESSKARCRDGTLPQAKLKFSPGSAGVDVNSDVRSGPARSPARPSAAETARPWPSAPGSGSGSSSATVAVSAGTGSSSLSPLSTSPVLAPCQRPRWEELRAASWRLSWERIAYQRSAVSGGDDAPSNLASVWRASVMRSSHGEADHPRWLATSV